MRSMSKLSKLHQSLLPKLRVVRIECTDDGWWDERNETEWFIVTYTQPISGKQVDARLRARDELDAFVRFTAKVREKGYLVEMDNDAA